MIGTYTHNGHALKALRVPSVIDLIEQLWQDEHANIKRNLDDANAGPELRLKTLSEHDKQRGLGSLLVRYAFTYKGASEIIEAAIKAADAKITVDDLKLDMSGEINRVALNLLGIEWSEIDASKEDEDKEPDPTQAVPVTG